MNPDELVSSFKQRQDELRTGLRDKQAVRMEALRRFIADQARVHPSIANQLRGLEAELCRPSTGESLAVVRPRIERAYWELLKLLDQVHAGASIVEEHDRFMVECDVAERTIAATRAEMDRVAAATREAMGNIIIAHKAGDMEEVQRISDEFARETE